MATIFLYDLAQRTQPCRCWSFNVWKTRIVLNYKNLPFTTIWVDSNTVASTLKSIGTPPNTSGLGFEYTVPTIKLPDGQVITDSAVIAQKLEDHHPLPPLHLDADLQAEAEAAFLKTLIPLFGIYIPRVVRDLVVESSIAAFRAPRENLLGMTFQELERTKGGQESWEAAEPGFHDIKQLLSDRKVDEGPFIKGSQVCYADFILVAGFEALKSGGDDIFEKVIGRNRAFRDLYDACKLWLENDR